MTEWTDAELKELIAGEGALMDQLLDGRFKSAGFVRKDAADKLRSLAASLLAARASLAIAKPYVEQRVEDDGGIDNCEIGDRLALESVRAALPGDTK